MEPKSHGFSPVATAGKRPSLFGRLGLLFALMIGSLSLQAQIDPVICNFSAGPGMTVSQDLDTDPAPFMTSFNTLGALGADVTVESDMTVRICFWGDMGGADETFDVLVAGQTFSSGNFGTDPTPGAQACRDFVIPAAAADTEIMDGEVNVTYDNFNMVGWSAISPTNTFNAQIAEVSFTYTVDIMLTSPADRCTDGLDATFVGTPAAGTVPGDMGVYSIFPSTPGFNTTTGVLDVFETDGGSYTVVYNYTVNGCTYETSSEIEIFEAPIANLQNTVVNCRTAGTSLDLSVMFDGINTSGGTFTVTGGGTVMGSSFTPPPGGGCFLVAYELPDPNDCRSGMNPPLPPYRDEAQLLVTIQPEPSFTITPETTDDTATSACRSGGSASVTVTNTSTTGGVAELTRNGDVVSFGAVELEGPAGPGSIVYELCVTEMSPAPPACSGITPPSACSATVCQTYTVYDDGVECGANAPFSSMCDPDLNGVDVCPVEVNPNLSLACSFFELNGPQFIDAGISLQDGVITCVDTEVCFTYRGSLPGSLGDAAAGGPTLGELNSATEVICDIITFEICTPRIPVVGRFCFDPIPLGSFEDACDQTVGQIVANALSTLVGGDGGGGIVVADTDGDGAFDLIVDEYAFPVVNQSACIPNNLETPTGVLTIRNVTAFPFSPANTCGVVTGESLDLLELLPIGAIPLVGPIIEDLLGAAGCNVELAFSDEETVRIPVLNRNPPVFANCNETGYYFTEDGVCDTEVNWSIPVVYDGCQGDVLAYIGRTAGTDDSNFAGTASPIVVPMEPGVYQTAGPIPGSDLDPGVYPVTYTAYSCAGVESTCTFDVIVQPGDPVLACPADVTLNTDVDDCAVIATGLAPLQGISCATVINYSIVFADGTTAETTTTYSAANRGTHNDVSGQTFPLGVSTATYTMLVDINGDGDVEDANETQTCEFTVTVLDRQRPFAQCQDIEVRLDNTGNVPVFPNDPLDGNAYVDGGSTDNCDLDLTYEIAKAGEPFGASVNYDCTETGYNLVTLRVTDDAGNMRSCLAQVKVLDFFDGIQFDLDVPEICLEANNPEQLDFSNYLVITLPDGTVLSHEDVENNTYLGDAVGGFGITAFAPSSGSASIDPGSVTDAGVYTPGTGSGFVTVSYMLALPGVANLPQNANVALSGCVHIEHSTFELRQPLEMDDPECECIQQNDRVVDLGEISGGLEPYTIQYGGVQFDVNGDGIADGFNGEYTYDLANGHNINDFTEDLGNLLVDYTQPTWSFTIVDARGCELFRSGSCDNDDETGTPMIDCTALGAVTLYTRDEPACEVQDTWTHTLPTDNCDVILYTYTIENPDGTIAGPFDLTALLNPDITNPLPDQFYGEYDFQHHSPTENVSTVTYYAEDAVGNFTQCSFTVTVIDDDPPRFINCPEPAVIVDAPEAWCAAFANYSLPLAVDNCGSVTVTQIDDTGLTSGSLFPVGITINTFEAEDETGNTLTCDVKIIVNDYHTPPTLECPNDVTTTNDPGDCGAVVDNIAPFGIDDNCPENLTVIYRIDDDEGNEVANGLDDASGNFFELGTSTVSYAVQDMPLLLITEVTHELSNPVDGVPATTPSCFDGAQNGDETAVDCGGSVCTSCNCPNNEVIVEIALDNNPAETTWEITVPNNGAVLYSGGPYAPADANTTVTIDGLCLADGCYDFVIRDAGLDGLAMGSYTVTTSGEVLASGGVFGTREVTNFCLDGTPTAASLAGTAASRDAIEITNFGSANLDVSCLMIERVWATGSETFAVPNGAILAPGGTLTIHFGDGHDDPANNIFYVAGSSDLAINEPTAYIASLSRSILDVVVLNGFDISGLLVPPAYELGGLTAADYWSGTVGPVLGGGIIRTTVWDTDTAEDFVPSEACMPITLGMLNPDLPQPTPNGASTAIQAQPTVRVECTPFEVTVTDDEPAVCGLYSDYLDPSGQVTVNYGECVETIITITEDFNVSDVNLSLSGSAGDLGNLTVTLISPEGTEIELFEAICPGTDAIEFTLDGDFGPSIDIACALLNNAGELVMPIGDIEAFNGEAVMGDWILQIGHNGQESVAPAVLDYILFISARDPYDQGDVTLDNDPDECGAEFTWFHPILFDNCPGGFIQWQIIFEGEEEQVNTLLPIFPENTEVTYFFEVGVSEVRYTLTDAAGNTSTCGFEVEVLDVQFPTLTCPPDLVIQLEGGECTTTDYPTIPIAADDNCPGFTFSSIPPGTPVPIGDTIVTIIITDASGNATECTYNLSVLEYIPEGPPACIGNQNVTLGPDCEAEITADMMLSGDDYRCYDNYIVTLYEVGEGGQPGLPIASSPFVGLDYVGQEIIAEVCDPATGLCCWGYVLIEFKDAPEFICPPDQTVRCTDSTLPRDMGEPIVTSCVPGGALIEFDDNVIDNGMCGEPRLIIQRTWTVTDGEGNSSTCLQTITMERFDLSEVVFPRDTTVNCADVLADPSLISTDSLGVPMINDSIPVAVVSLCSGAVNMTEDRFDICENSYIIFRTWRVINQCDENPLAGAITRTQTIRVEDIDGPDLICPDDQVSSTGPNECLGNYQVPPLVVGDACSAVTYQVAVDGDTLPYRADHQYLFIGLELGEHEVRYIATDECGKWSSCAYTLTVADLVEPYASCDDQLNISIGGGDIANGAFGTNRVFATDVNEGSSDNCSEVSLLVRREIVDPQSYDCLDQFDYDSDGIVLNDEVRRDPNDFSNPNGWFTPWLPYADFTCCDVGQSLLVELQVTDQAGNSNVCWQDVVPEDKLRPFCYAPANVTLSCVDLPLTFPGDIEAAYNEDRQATVAMLNALFGEPSGTDNCRLDTIVENRPSMNLNDCGWGTITRRFEVWQLNPAGDANGNGAIDRDEVLYSVNPCAQLITVTETHDFTIDFPEDAAADCADPCIPEIEIIMPGCDNVLVNTGEPQRFAASGDECYKLGITYDVINWCIWDGEYEGTVIKRRTEDDGEALPTDRAVESAERPVLHVFGPNENALTITLDRRHARRQTCGSNVSGDDSRLRDDEVSDEEDSIYSYADNEDWRGILAGGRWQYTQFIKVYDETVPEVTVDEFGGPTELCPDLEVGQFGDAFGNCEAEVTITFSVSDDCDALDGAVENVVLMGAALDGFAVDANRDGDIKVNEFTADDIPFSLVDNGDNTYTFSGSFPIIESALGDNVYHALRVIFEDGCGNQTSEYIEFDVVDCKGPAPSCINGVTITIMPQPEGGCAMATWASDFEASPVYDCTGQGPEVNPSNDEQERVTKLAIYRQSTVEDDPNFVPSPEDTGLTLTQDDPEQTFVYVYAFDEEGNYDYCTTYIQVEAHVDCGNTSTGSLAGTIVREDDETVESVEMTVSGGQAASVSTGADGNFLISGLAFGTDLTLTPFRNDDHDNGVTTFDIVLITKQILGTELLDSPYKLIAADANNSGTITTLDIIQIRKLILNIDTEFTNNTSWRFVAEDYTFPSSLNPWFEVFPEVFNVNNFSGSMLDVDFVAIKVGDVNNSATANSLQGGGRTLHDTFHLEMDEQELKMGNTYTVPVYANELMAGYQGTLQLDGVELVDIVYGQAGAQHFGMQYAEEGTITMSWNNDAVVETQSIASPSGITSPLFSLVIHATTDQLLSEAVAISSRYTAAEAYSQGGEHRNLSLQFNGETVVAEQFELYQNTPNPVVGATLISFYLPEANKATLTISDVSGRTIMQLSGDYAAGFHTLNVTKVQLKDITGVMSYTLTSGEYTATKQMVVVK